LKANIPFLSKKRSFFFFKLGPPNIAVDINNDGKMDLIATATNSDTVAWYENDGRQNFTKHVISSTANLVSIQKVLMACRVLFYQNIVQLNAMNNSFFLFCHYSFVCLCDRLVPSGQVISMVMAMLTL